MTNGKLKCSFPDCTTLTPALVNGEPRCLEHLKIAQAARKVDG